MMPLTMGNLRATICEFGPPSLIDQIGCKEEEDRLGGEGGTCRVEGVDFYSFQITSRFRTVDTLPLLIFICEPAFLFPNGQEPLKRHIVKSFGKIFFE
jgi:hypothetical protein